MLNRLFIVVGILAILGLSAAFLVPRLISWGDYRDRMEALAGEVLGTEVRIEGDIAFTLLPEPSLRFMDVAIGPVDAPLARIASVEGAFSLTDFLRDRYTITKLVLDRPAIALHLDEEGALDSGFNLPLTTSESNISIQEARLVDGSLTVLDARSGKSFVSEGVAGDLRLTAVRGPFAFQGRASYDGVPYAVRISTQEMAADRTIRVSGYVAPAEGGFNLSAEGVLSTGERPAFIGDLVFRKTPPPALNTEGVLGDMVLTGAVDANTDRIVMPTYELQPDENRAGSRLTGALSITLGPEPEFNAVVSGGVLALPARDALAEEGPQPYELVRLLSEVPLPPVPPLAGTVSMDVGEVNLRGLAVREVRLDAQTDGATWTIRNLEGQLAGETSLRLVGTLDASTGTAVFNGHMGLSTERLDAFAALWKKPAENNPLFNMPASFDGRVRLDAASLEIEDGRLDLAGEPHDLSATVGLTGTRRLALSAGLGNLSALTTQALLGLLPDAVSDPAFAVTFPAGSLAVTAAAASLADIDGKGLALTAGWSAGGLTIERIAAEDAGGVSFDLSGKAAGTLTAPAVSAAGTISVNERAGRTTLTRLFDLAGTPGGARTALLAMLPAALTVELDDADATGRQALVASGTAGAARVMLDAQLTQGLANALTAPATIRLGLRSDDPAALTRQLGLGPHSVVPERTAMSVDVTAQGTPAALETELAIAGGGDHLSFAGNLAFADFNALSAQGMLDFKLSDPSGLAALAGAGGVHVPAVVGTARLSAGRDGAMLVTGLALTSNGATISGDLSRTAQGGATSITGNLALGSVDVGALATLLGGPAAVLHLSDTVWPDGPLDIGTAARMTLGRINVTAEAVTVPDGPSVKDAAFEMSWDEDEVRIRDFAGTLGEGTITLEAGLCCSGPLPDKTLTGRIAVTGVGLDSVLPAGTANVVGGVLDGSARFEGTGNSVDAALRGLTGEGSFALRSLAVQKFDPGAFAAVAGLGSILELEGSELTAFVALVLGNGPFESPDMSGSFTIAGGVVRTPNLAAEAPAAHLFGGASLRLADLGLDGSFTMRPVAPIGEAGLINPSNSLVTANLGGTLTAPEQTLDLTTMVDAIKVRAFELEVERLEALAAEDEARRAADAEQARIEEEARQAAAAAEAARIAEEARLAEERRQAEAAAEAQRAADEAAAQRAAEQRAAEQRAAQRAAEQELARQLQLQQGQVTSPSFTTLPPAPVPNP